MKIVINAGHTKFAPGTGAKLLLNESTETRRIAYTLMSLLSKTSHEIVPAVFDRSSNNLKEAVDLANKENADYFISIHLNAGKGSGVECYTWKGQQLTLATNICEEINKLGYPNRGVKDGSKLYVIKNTKCKAILVECCFVDTVKDCDLYDYELIAECIRDAIVQECGK